ncbi:MAG: 50S ribosomal protein L11 methyltransferase [Hahellaceae bacterium]|nr:50S ribosomal protein L11 methyltransferase [Hahellaceae bacterium]
MSWLQISIQSTDQDAPQLETLLDNLGAVSVTMLDAEDEPVLEPDIGTTPLWSRTVVVALFPADAHQVMIRDQLQQSGISSQAIACEILEDRDWEREWMTHFKPTRFGQRLWIVPSWAEPPEPEAINLDLDPGLAFGTGTHPTTALCLTWLDGQVLENKSLIDYGCGSGILAVAALLLGAERATATDIDPQALEATLDNAARNRVTRLSCFAPEKMPQETADILIANILANPLISLAQELASLTRPGGTIALSGILEEQADNVRSRYANWFDMNVTEVQDGWVLLSGVRRGEPA